MLIGLQLVVELFSDWVTTRGGRSLFMRSRLFAFGVITGGSWSRILGGTEKNQGKHEWSELGKEELGGRELDLGWAYLMLGSSLQLNNVLIQTFISVKRAALSTTSVTQAWGLP